jgi:hypothetical protein
MKSYCLHFRTCSLMEIRLRVLIKVLVSGLSVLVSVLPK